MKFKNLAKHFLGKKSMLAICSGILLFLSYPPFNLFFLQWIALIPLLIVLHSSSKRESYLFGTIFGTIAILGGFNWIHIWAEKVTNIPFPASYLIAFGYSFATAQIFGLISLVYSWIREKHVLHDIFLFPIIFVALFSLYPMLFYFKLGDAQSYFLTAIQAIDHTGVWGLDFIIIITNISLYQLFFFPKETYKSPSFLIAIGVVFVWFGYGIFSLNLWKTEIKSWDKIKVGMIQTNRLAQLKTPAPELGYSRTFPMEMGLSQNLKNDTPDFIVWPEGNFFGYSYWKPVRDAFKTHVERLNIPIVFHDTTFSLNDGKKVYYNSSLLMNKNGDLQNIYHKIKRVPFGEYIPFTEKFPFLKVILGDYLSNLSAGTEQKEFKVGLIRLIPKLCYESLFPEFVANGIGKFGNGKVIVVQSQDGWFGKSSQPEQHLTASSLRAIENRVPLVHAINNGSSAVTLPTGEYVFKSPFFQKGQWTVSVPFDANSGGSFYSAYPYFFINLIRTVLIVLIGIRIYLDRFNFKAREIIG